MAAMLRQRRLPIVRSPRHTTRILTTTIRRATIGRVYYPQPYNAAPSYYPQPYNAAPSYYPQAYNGALPNYGAAMPGGLANMIQRRDNAQVLYQQALRAGNRVRAKHLNNDVVALNKNIATTRNRGGYGRAGSFDQPYASSYGNGYGNSNLNALAGPLMRNFIP